MRHAVLAALLVVACTRNVYGPDRVTCVEERPDTIAMVTAGGQPLAYVVRPLCWHLRSDDGKEWVRVKREDGTYTWERA